VAPRTKAQAEQQRWRMALGFASGLRHSMRWCDVGAARPATLKMTKKVIKIVEECATLAAEIKAEINSREAQP